MKAGKAYPHLAKNIDILEAGTLMPLDECFTKFWVVLLTNWAVWNNNASIREEFLSWFREYAEMVWSVGGALTATHGFIPREMEVEFIKKEIGQTEYRLMERIKNLIDPNHIMNPKVKFEFEEE